MLLYDIVGYVQYDLIKCFTCGRHIFNTISPLLSGFDQQSLQHYCY